MEPGLQTTCPRSTSSRFSPRRRSPTFSPACPSSSNLRNISTPVTVVFWLSGRIPTISTSSLIFTTPRSIRPVITVPRPVIVKTSSTGIKNGLSISRAGCGINASTASMSSMIFSPQAASPSRALSAEMRTIGVSSPGNSYLLRSSRTSISTSSRISSSSTMSDLLSATTIEGTPTWRARRTCSLVCGIGPSVAATTRIAPSI